MVPISGHLDKNWWKNRLFRDIMRKTKVLWFFDVKRLINFERIELAQIWQQIWIKKANLRLEKLSGVVPLFNSGGKKLFSCKNLQNQKKVCYSNQAAWPVQGLIRQLRPLMETRIKEYEAKQFSKKSQKLPM